VQQRFHDLQKHDHVDTIDVESSQQKQQRQVRGEDADRPRNPLIVPRLIEQKRECEETRAHIQCPLHVVLQVDKVVSTVLDELDDFQDEVEKAVEDDEPDADELDEIDALVEGDKVRSRTMMQNGRPDGCIVMVARREGDDEVGEQNEKEQVEDKVEHVDRKAIGEPFLSEECFAEWMAEMIRSTKLHHHLYQRGRHWIHSYYFPD
jgi:hypothetical protein